MSKYSTHAIIPVLLFSVVAAHSAPNSADSDFESLAARYVDEMPALNPITATALGDHRFDDRVDQISHDSRQARIEFAKSILADLDTVDIGALKRSNQVDARLLRHELEYSVWSVAEIQEWAWNPTIYTELAGQAIYGLMARDFAPVNERLLNAAARLNEMPRLFEQVRRTLTPARVPKVHAETAVLQHPGFMATVEDMVVPQLDKLTPDDRASVANAIESARQAAAEHQIWLQDELLPRATGEFRIGRELYERKLQFTLNSPLSRLEVRERAESEYAAVREQMYEIAKTIYTRRFPHTFYPDNPDHSYKQAIIRSALEEAYKKLPGRDEVVAVARESVRSTTDFVREHNIVRIPDEPLEIIIMPEFERGVSLAYCDAPGPLDKGQKTFYAVAPLPENWTTEQVASFLREYNILSIHDLTMHEAMPGHFLQLAHASKHPSVLRALLESGPFIEGWAVYAERVMIDEGYYENDPLMRLINLKWYLRAIINAIIDQAIHVDNMTEDAAMRLMIEGGFQEEREAAGKWVRAQLTSTQLATYFVGYQEHADLRREVESASGDDFSLREYHDTVLSFGSPPVRFVRSLMIGAPIPE